MIEIVSRKLTNLPHIAVLEQIFNILRIWQILKCSLLPLFTGGEWEMKKKEMYGNKKNMEKGVDIRSTISWLTPNAILRK